MDALRRCTICAICSGEAWVPVIGKDGAEPRWRHHYSGIRMLGSAMKWFALALLSTASCMLAQEGGVPVVIDGQEILRVYAPVGPVSVQERAPAIEDRILTLARKRFSGRIGTRPIPSENAT